MPPEFFRGPNHHDKTSSRAACHDRAHGDAIRSLSVARANRAAGDGAGNGRTRQPAGKPQNRQAAPPAAAPPPRTAAARCRTAASAPPAAGRRTAAPARAAASSARTPRRRRRAAAPPPPSAACCTAAAAVPPPQLPVRRRLRPWRPTPRAKPTGGTLRRRNARLRRTPQPLRTCSRSRRQPRCRAAAGLPRRHNRRRAAGPRGAQSSVAGRSTCPAAAAEAGADAGAAPPASRRRSAHRRRAPGPLHERPVAGRGTGDAAHRMPRPHAGGRRTDLPPGGQTGAGRARSYARAADGRRADPGVAAARPGPDARRSGCRDPGTAPHGRFPRRAAGNPGRRPHGLHRTRPDHRRRSRRPVVHPPRRSGSLPFRRARYPDPAGRQRNPHHRDSSRRQPDHHGDRPRRPVAAPDSPGSAGPRDHHHRQHLSRSRARWAVSMSTCRRR